MADVLEDVEGLAILGVVAFAAYYIWKHMPQQQPPPGGTPGNVASTNAGNIAAQATAPIQSATYSVGQYLNPIFGPPGTESNQGAFIAGTTPEGIHYVYDASGLTTYINNVPQSYDLTAQVGPQGQTVQQLLNDGWIHMDIAEMLGMSSQY